MTGIPDFPFCDPHRRRCLIEYIFYFVDEALQKIPRRHRYHWRHQYASRF